MIYLNQYLCRSDRDVSDSFSYWLHYGLCHIASITATYSNDFEVYTNGSQILLSRSYKTLFDSDHENAFIYLRNETVNFLKDIRKRNYNDLESISIPFKEDTSMADKKFSLGYLIFVYD